MKKDTSSPQDVFFDSHAHLEMSAFDADVDAVVERAQAAGVRRIVTVGTEIADWPKALALSDKFPSVYAALGLHPHGAQIFNPEIKKRLRELLGHPRIVALGEIGLDYYRNLSPQEPQRRAFREQLQLAKELSLPIIIHSRAAAEETYRMMAEAAPYPRGGVIHCFSGDLPQASKYLDLGFYISFTGTITYKKAEDTRQVAAGLPIEKILIETDSPYLTPEPDRGKRNEPALVVRAAETIAKVKRLSRSDVARITTKNAETLFGLNRALSTQGVIAYPIRDSLYLNITNRCSNACIFCAKRKDYTVKGHFLKLKQEPSVEEVVRAVDEQPGTFREVVFCGFGEPLLRLEDVKEIARRLKKKGVKRIRVNTDGLANLVYGRDVTQELQGLVDAVSVSLNAPDAAAYAKLCPSGFGLQAYEGVKSFLRLARGRIPEVAASALDYPGVDIDACRAVAEALGVSFRLRKYDEVG